MWEKRDDASMMAWEERRKLVTVNERDASMYLDMMEFSLDLILITSLIPYLHPSSTTPICRDVISNSPLVSCNFAHQNRTDVGSILRNTPQLGVARRELVAPKFFCLRYCR